MLFDPDQIWKELASSKGRSGWIIRRLDPTANTGILLGVHHPECQPSVLVEIRSKLMPTTSDWPSTKGIEIKADRWGEAGVGVRMTLVEPSLRSVFCALVNDLIPLAAGDDSAQRVHARLEAWLALLFRRRPGGLDKDGQVSLMSELEVLRRLSFHMPVPRLIQGWEGPLGDRGVGRGLHDFRLPSVRVEVKGTARIPALSVNISNHAQLDPDAIGHDALFLAVVCWSSGTTGTKSLPSMISAVRSLVASHAFAAVDLEDRLRSAGWMDGDSDLYQGQTWSLLDLRWYEVIDGFPRLRCRDLPPGIIDGKYSISLQACARWHRDEQTAMTFIKKNSDEYRE